MVLKDPQELRVLTHTEKLLKEQQGSINLLTSLSSNFIGKALFDTSRSLSACLFFVKYKCPVYRPFKPFSEADLGLLQHPRWSSL